MTPDARRIEAFRQWGLGGFPQCPQLSVHRNLEVYAKSGVRGEMSSVVRRAISSVQ